MKTCRLNPLCTDYLSVGRMGPGENPVTALDSCPSLQRVQTKFRLNRILPTGYPPFIPGVQVLNTSEFPPTSGPLEEVE
jgi:hypothetical protein